MQKFFFSLFRTPIHFFWRFLDLHSSYLCFIHYLPPVFIFIPHPWNECDLWEPHSCTLIKPSPCGCDRPHHKWQNGVKEWHEEWKLALYPCDIFTHVDTARRYDVFFLPDAYPEAQQSPSKFNSLYRSECALCSAPRFHPLAAELCSRLWRDFLKIGGGGQWSHLNLIYSIWERHMEHFVLTVLSREKRWNETPVGHCGLIPKCSAG